jgi:hypothetical protein
MLWRTAAHKDMAKAAGAPGGATPSDTDPPVWSDGRTVKGFKCVNLLPLRHGPQLTGIGQAFDLGFLD